MIFKYFRKTAKQPPTPKKTPKQKNVSEHPANSDQSCSMLACFCSDKKVEEISGDQDRMDKVEFAFRKFDADGDGFLSWEEFQQVFTTFTILLT